MEATPFGKKMNAARFGEPSGPAVRNWRVSHSIDAKAREILAPRRKSLAEMQDLAAI